MHTEVRAMALVTTIGRGGQAAAASVRAELTGRRTDVSGVVFRAALLSGIALSVGVLVVLLTSQVVAGWPVLSGRLSDFLTATTNSNPDRAGIAQALKGSFWIGLIVVAVAFPIGIGTAVYLEEYAVHNRMTWVPGRHRGGDRGHAGDRASR